MLLARQTICISKNHRCSPAMYTALTKPSIDSKNMVVAIVSRHVWKHRTRNATVTRTEAFPATVFVFTYDLVPLYLSQFVCVIHPRTLAVLSRQKTITLPLRFIMRLCVIEHNVNEGTKPVFKSQIHAGTARQNDLP